MAHPHVDDLTNFLGAMYCLPSVLTNSHPIGTIFMNATTC